MKNVLVIATFFICFAGFAQPPQGSNDRPPRSKMERPNFTPEQIAELQTKKLTLMLNLDEKQQAKVSQLELKAAMEREARKPEKGQEKEITGEEKFEGRSEMLDLQIEHKNAMRSILSKEQFEKWEKSLMAKGKRRRHKAHHGMKGEKR